MNSESNIQKFQLRISTLMLLTLVVASIATVYSWNRAHAAKSGLAGVNTLLRTKKIRVATTADIDAWEKAAIAAGNEVDAPFETYRNIYVILNDVTLPDNLYGADRCAFIIPNHVPFPRGPRCHNDFYIMDGSALGMIWIGNL